MLEDVCRQVMSNSARKSCTRCKHVNCTCRGSGGGDSNDGDNLDDSADAGQALSSSPAISEGLSRRKGDLCTVVRKICL